MNCSSHNVFAFRNRRLAQTVEPYAEASLSTPLFLSCSYESPEAYCLYEAREPSMMLRIFSSVSLDT